MDSGGMPSGVQGFRASHGLEWPDMAWHCLVQCGMAWHGEGRALGCVSVWRFLQTCQRPRPYFIREELNNSQAAVCAALCFKPRLLVVQTTTQGFGGGGECVCMCVWGGASTVLPYDWFRGYHVTAWVLCFHQANLQVSQTQHVGLYSMCCLALVYFGVQYFKELRCQNILLCKQLCQSVTYNIHVGTILKCGAMLILYIKQLKCLELLQLLLSY